MRIAQLVVVPVASARRSSRRTSSRTPCAARPASALQATDVTGAAADPRLGRSSLARRRSCSAATRSRARSTGCCPAVASTPARASSRALRRELQEELGIERRAAARRAGGARRLDRAGEQRAPEARRPHHLRRRSHRPLARGCDLRGRGRARPSAVHVRRAARGRRSIRRSSASSNAGSRATLSPISARSGRPEKREILAPHPSEAQRRARRSRRASRVRRVPARAPAGDGRAPRVRACPATEQARAARRFGARQRLREQPVGEPRVPRQQRTVEVRADRAADAAPLEAGLAVVPEPVEDAAERRRARRRGPSGRRGSRSPPPSAARRRARTRGARRRSSAARRRRCRAGRRRRPAARLPSGRGRAARAADIRHRPRAPRRHPRPQLRSPGPWPRGRRRSAPARDPARRRRRSRSTSAGVESPSADRPHVEIDPRRLARRREHRDVPAIGVDVQIARDRGARRRTFMRPAPSTAARSRGPRRSAAARASPCTWAGTRARRPAAVAREAAVERIRRCRARRRSRPRPGRRTQSAAPSSAARSPETISRSSSAASGSKSTSQIHDTSRPSAISSLSAMTATPSRGPRTSVRTISLAPAGFLIRSTSSVLSSDVDAARSGRTPAANLVQTGGDLVERAADRTRDRRRGERVVDVVEARQRAAARAVLPPA